MAYLSQDLQKIFLNFINKTQLPASMLKSAEEYSPRLGSLLRAKNKTVFESDLETLANFAQNSAFSQQISPNQYKKPYHIQQTFHKQIYGIKKQRDLNKLKKNDRKQDAIEKRLQSIHNPTGSKAMEEIIKKANIHKARDLSARQERAREYVKELADQRRKNRASQNVLRTMDHENQTPDADIKTTSNYQPIKSSDLAV